MTTAIIASRNNIQKQRLQRRLSDRQAVASSSASRHLGYISSPHHRNSEPPRCTTQARVENPHSSKNNLTLAQLRTRRQSGNFAFLWVFGASEFFADEWCGDSCRSSIRLNEHLLRDLPVILSLTSRRSSESFASSPKVKRLCLARLRETCATCSGRNEPVQLGQMRRREVVRFLMATVAETKK